MSKAQDKYLHRKSADPAEVAEPAPPQPTLPGIAANLQSQPAILGASIKQLAGAIESVEVGAGRAEQLVMSRTKDHIGPSTNHAQVAPSAEGETIQATLEWLAHRLNSATDRLSAALNHLEGL